MMSEKQYRVAYGGGDGANKACSETSLPSHGGKAQGGTCQATEKIFDARLPGDICWRKGCV